MSQKLRLTFIALEEISLLPAAPRLARRLLLMAENYGEASDPRPVIHLAQEQLALMLALSRQTTNQILKELEAQGILRLSYAEIEILDLQRLRQAAQ
jgi:CRP-like cAMP-binding protein